MAGKRRVVHQTINSRVLIAAVVSIMSMFHATPLLANRSIWLAELTLLERRAILNLGERGVLTYEERRILEALRPSETKRRNKESRQRESVERQRFIDRIARNKRIQRLIVRSSRLSVGRPSIDLEIAFGKSAVLSPEAERELIKLGRALTSPDLQGTVFLIAGHTDARGNDRENQRLTEQQATLVKRFLQKNFGIAAERLISAGYGEEQLKNPFNPFGAENNRIQIINLEEPVARR